MYGLKPLLKVTTSFGAKVLAQRWRHFASRGKGVAESPVEGSIDPNNELILIPPFAPLTFAWGLTTGVM